MASNMVISEALCYVMSYLRRIERPQLVDILANFYNDAELEKAKELLFSVAAKLKLDGCPEFKPHPPNDSNTRRAFIAQEICQLATFLDDKVWREQLPHFAAANIRRLPSYRPPLINISQCPQETCRLLMEEVNGNLFSSNDSLVHCVSRDLNMGKGIATEFKKRFGNVTELRQQNVAVGDVAVLHQDGRYIYYLITKERYFHKPTIETLRRSLLRLKVHCLTNHVDRLAMPRIGCGLDKLDWNDVSRLIEDTFVGTNIHVTIYTK